MKTNIETSIQVLTTGLRQRQDILHKVRMIRKNLQNQSDLGWLFTLGSDELGTMMAVSSMEEAREWIDFEARLETEIRIIQESINNIEMK